MQTAIVTDQGQVLIPAEIRQQLGITPGSRLHFIIDGNTIRVVQAAIKTSFPEDGYGMLVCAKPGERHLSDFDIAQAMLENENDRD